jgi:hypothetical protein
VKKALLVLTALLVAACAMPALAAEGEGDAPKPKTKTERKRRKRRSRLHKPRPLVASCLLLSRLSLSKEQLAKAKPLDEEIVKKYEEYKKEAGEDKAKQIELNKKLWRMAHESRKKIVAMLTAAQKKKHTAGVKVLQEFHPKQSALKKEYYKGREKAGRNRKKHKELRDAYRAKLKPVLVARGKKLDEQVGKRPESTEKPRDPGKKKPEGGEEPPKKEEKKDPGGDDFDF